MWLRRHREISTYAKELPVSSVPLFKTSEREQPSLLHLPTVQSPPKHLPRDAVNMYWVSRSHTCHLYFICLGILFSWCLFVVCLETGAHYVAQASLELRRDPFAAASQALGRKLCATTSSTVLLVLFALEALCSQGLPQSHYSPQDGLKSWSSCLSHHHNLSKRHYYFWHL
jgi:hypothetical protein